MEKNKVQKRGKRWEEKKKNDRKPMPGQSLAEREKEKKRGGKKALHRIKPGSTDTKGYRLLCLQ